MTRFKTMIALVALVITLASGASFAATKAGAVARPQNCAKFSGTVVLTYTNPDTIILHIIRGKVNAATTFTTTPTTSYARNGLPSTFAQIRIGDVGTITATEVLPSGTLLACAVIMTGP